MGRVVEIVVGLAAVGSIATFLGFRALARKAVRSLARQPKPLGRPPEGTDVERRPPEV